MREAAHTWGRHRLDRALDAASDQPPGIAEVEPWLGGCRFVCAGGYSDYADSVAADRRRLSRRELATRFIEIDTPMGTPQLDLAPRELRVRLLAALAIDDLLTDMHQRRLLVATIEEQTAKGIRQRRLLFGDPHVGSFEALLVTAAAAPDTGARPAIVAVPGHRDSADDFASHPMVQRLARQGYAILIPTFRAHDCGLTETLVSLDLLRSATTLIGLKVYETLLLVRYLDTFDGVDSSRIGLLAHSGGSAVADLAVRVTDRFGAKVIDLTVNYRDRCGAFGPHCQTVPDLFPLGSDVASEDDLTIPTLSVPYKFDAPAVQRQISEFFAATLGSS